jgi:hypothetical protein
MTSAERRQIGQAIKEYDHLRSESGRELLCRLAKEHAPDPPGPLHVIANKILDRAAKEAYYAPQPKPRKRLVSRKALREYRAAHPFCEVVTCGAEACPEPHHIISRKMKGDDVPANLLSLCARCHRAFHNNGPMSWLAAFGRSLPADTRSKVAAALRIT